MLVIQKFVTLQTNYDTIFKMNNNKKEASVIRFDMDGPVKQGVPKYLENMTEEVRRDKNDEVTAYVLKRKK